MTTNINNGNMDDLELHVKETLKGAVSQGVEDAKVIGALWGVESVKVHIAERASKQDFLTAEDYAWLCAKALNKILRGMA
jgi:hypothetical protein